MELKFHIHVWSCTQRILEISMNLVFKRRGIQWKKKNLG
jgi:hypothetical protein